MSTNATKILALLGFIGLAGTAYAQSKAANPGSAFVIDPARPFVYVQFDRIGPAMPGDEPIDRMWLRLVNNCNVAILVRAFGAAHGHSFDRATIGVTRDHPDKEIGLVDDVVPNTEPLARAIYAGSDGVMHESPPRIEDQGKMPRGYDFDVSTSVSIAAGQSVFFSVPVNHVSKKWHMEIPFEFDVPRGTGYRDPHVGGLPHMVVEYGLWDLPPEQQAKVEGIIEQLKNTK